MSNTRAHSVYLCADAKWIISPSLVIAQREGHSYFTTFTESPPTTKTDSSTINGGIRTNMENTKRR